MARDERKNYSYQFGSTARAYTEAVDPLKVPSPVEPAKKPGRKAKPATRRKVDVAFGIQMAICGAVLFSCSMFYIGNYAQLRINQTELKTLKDEKIMVTNAITELQAKMHEKLDLSKIEAKATNELGMTKPYAHQIVYIELPEKSYTTYEQTK